jgi:hypothetical protein
VEEAERRARVEGELRLRERQLLEEQRQRHAHGRSGRSAAMAAAGVAVLLVAVGGGLAARASQQHQAEMKALEREIASQYDQARAAQLDFEAKVRALEEKARRAVAEAKTPKEQALILGDLKRQKQALERARLRPPRRTAAPTQPTAATQPPIYRVPGKPEIKDDPLGGDPAIRGGGF